jgi:hypothetical protein
MVSVYKDKYSAVANLRDMTLRGSVVIVVLSDFYIIVIIYGRKVCKEVANPKKR